MVAASVVWAVAVLVAAAAFREQLRSPYASTCVAIEDGLRTSKRPATQTTREAGLVARQTDRLRGLLVCLTNDRWRGRSASVYIDWDIG